MTSAGSWTIPTSAFILKCLSHILKPLEHPENAWVVAELELPIGLEQIDNLTHFLNG